jgi:hypothetical protein
MAEAPDFDGEINYLAVGLPAIVNRRRDDAFRKMRQYCGGPFYVVREEEKSRMTVLSFPVPEVRKYLWFRCGEAPAVDPLPSEG